MLKENQDAFGRAMYDYYLSGMKATDIDEVIERNDGYIDTAGGPAAYFSEHRHWAPIEKKAMKYARGRVLDIGCGAGRHSLFLQAKGLDVVGIDNSPLAIEVCNQRGLKKTAVLSINQINSKLGTFDTIIMMGNNFGLFGSYNGAKRLLKKMSRITSGKGRIIAVTLDVYNTDNPAHLEYQEMNRKRGRMSGQIRLRARYQKYTTPWLDYLMVSKEEMEDILEGTDWKVNRYIDSAGPYYVAVIDKKK